MIPGGGRAMTGGCCISQVLGWKPREVPTDTARKERRKPSLTQQEQWDAPDVFIGGRAQHDSQGMQTGQQGPSLGLPQTHTRGDSFTKGLTNIREGQGGWEVGREGRGRGRGQGQRVTWPLLLHTSSGHQPGSTVLQLVSARPRLPLLRPLSQMGRQTPSLPVCPQHR